MKNELKLALSVLLIVFGIWLLLPEISAVKPSDVFGIDLVLLPYLVDLIKGVIPVFIFLFGCLLLWIELDEFRTKRSGEDDVDYGDDDDSLDFEDVEYKDLNCPECGEDFKTEIGLKVHRKVNHPDSFEEE